jgi:hypothetical protein
VQHADDVYEVVMLKVENGIGELIQGPKPKLMAFDE